MPKFSQPARTVRDIKTLAGKADDLHTPHKMYMRLFALETERHRRQQERESAMLRVTNIDARCLEIDQEKEQLLQLLGVETIPLVPPSAAGSPATKGSMRTPAGDPRRRGRLTTQSTPVETSVSDAVKIRY
ncbi:MAG: hypothetical protein JZU52_22255 [Lamprocystis purpurea]|jgi:hypothetical protein|uniref:hypothetical protein n=1 Tax=Lamprocystis purpurea TaxID=61598 RepID=UPI00037E02CB|nr:hypothetical protein [Lamprocystis purpurea]MBV5276240.1 hypothetical protein [Lamprocystis purpurea]